MKCAEFEKQIDFFIDDELGSSLANDVELHMKECPACKKTSESLQTLRKLIRKDISVSSSSQLDGRVLEAFSRHHENKQKKNWRAFVFGQIVIPRPAFALALLIFTVLTGLAFQVGKMTAKDVGTKTPIAETANLSPQMSEKNVSPNFVKESENKTSAAQVIKFIEVPVVKEKIITRYVFVNKQATKENTIKAGSAKLKPNNFPLNSSVNENRYLTQVDLKQFQPVAEMKVKITKKDENNEK
jgi:hypothetical protein